MGEPEPGLQADVLTIEPARVGPRAGRVLLALILVALLAGAGWWAWTQRPEPPRDLTLDDLQGAYTGMVRSDGTNDLSVIDRDEFTGVANEVTPDACRPLVDSTLGNAFPPAALDGVSTYWLSSADTVGLFTLRYGDSAAAAAQFDQMAAAVPACVDPSRSVEDGTGRLGVVAAPSRAEDRGDLAFTFDRTAGGRYAVHVVRYANTISWQFRYDPRRAAYDPTAALQLNDGLVTQLQAVRALPR